MSRVVLNESSHKFRSFSSYGPWGHSERTIPLALANNEYVRSVRERVTGVLTRGWKYDKAFCVSGIEWRGQKAREYARIHLSSQIRRYLKRMLPRASESPEADNATRFVLGINSTHSSNSRCLALPVSRARLRETTSYINKVRNKVISRYKLCYFKLLAISSALILSLNIHFVVQSCNKIIIDRKLFLCIN